MNASSFRSTSGVLMVDGKMDYKAAATLLKQSQLDTGVLPSHQFQPIQCVVLVELDAPTRSDSLFLAGQYTRVGEGSFSTYEFS